MRRVRSLAQNWHPIAGEERGEPFPRSQVKARGVRASVCAGSTPGICSQLPLVRFTTPPCPRPFRLPIGVTIVAVWYTGDNVVMQP